MNSMKNILKGDQRSDKKFEELATTVLSYEAAAAFLIYMVLSILVIYSI